MDLDQVFAGVPRVGGKVEGCTYCYSESDLDLLGGDPAEVPDDLVGSFATEVTDHWSADQYGLIWRGLAPRILTLLAAQPDELILRGLAYARFSTWPAEEQAAIRQAMREIIATAFTGDKSAHRLASLICAAAHIDQQMAPWLAYLDTLGADADAAIARLAENWARTETKGTLAWWQYFEDSAPLIRDWLYSDALWERLTRAGADDAKIAIGWM
ncbi:hypothetical protein DMH04_18845 [Kibdelosporangium aridum]|uniref:Uncharacterized protein n=1 Tax=Kibdelosporangium aridum TaxID=2030 RepID=A0A428ZA98_KIBAR|nr:hypothetical protein [Kibdelosporangium aridum]RSM84920.1 hypothetical protein DMH04_18845 [Kibdelosporangium aridum]